MSKYLTTPEFRLSYPNLYEAQDYLDNKKFKFSIVMLFDKSIDLKALKLLAKEAADAKWPDPKKRPKHLRNPFRDGDIEKPDADGYQNAIFIGASKEEKHGKVTVIEEVNGVHIRISEEDKDKIYGGCYCKASVNAYAYDTGANKGVAFGLRSVKIIRGGDPFGIGPVNVDDDFEIENKQDVNDTDFAPETTPEVKEESVDAMFD